MSASASSRAGETTDSGPVGVTTRSETVAVVSETVEAAGVDGVAEDLVLLLSAGGGLSSLRLGRKAELMSPIEGKNSSGIGSSLVSDLPPNQSLVRLHSQGMTLSKLGEPSHTSARSSMMTTMFVSHGNNRSRLLWVIPEPTQD